MVDSIDKLKKASSTIKYLSAHANKLKKINYRKEAIINTVNSTIGVFQPENVFLTLNNFKRDHLSFIAIQAELIEKLLNFKNEFNDSHEEQRFNKRDFNTWDGDDKNYASNTYPNLDKFESNFLLI